MLNPINCPNITYQFFALKTFQVAKNEGDPFMQKFFMYLQPILLFRVCFCSNVIQDDQKTETEGVDDEKSTTPDQAPVIEKPTPTGKGKGLILN